MEAYQPHKLETPFESDDRNQQFYHFIYKKCQRFKRWVSLKYKLPVRLQGWWNGRHARLRIQCLVRESSSLSTWTICSISSIGGTSPCQGEGYGFKSRMLLQASPPKRCYALLGIKRCPARGYAGFGNISLYKCDVRNREGRKHTGFLGAFLLGMGEQENW